MNAVTVDFGGGSFPSHFDLWGGSTTPHLPQAVAPGAHLVLTMTSSFNFDTSDLFGEACHVNTQVAGVVHVTVNGVQTDYQDSHQILNSDGADLGSCPLDGSEQTQFSAVGPGAQPPALPVDDVVPSVTVAGQRERSRHTGRGWSGQRVRGRLERESSARPRIALDAVQLGRRQLHRHRWRDRYDLPPDRGRRGETLRLQVVASNTSGSVAVSSSATPLVQSGPPVAQLGHTQTGFTSEFVYNTTPLTWTETATTNGTADDFAFFARGAGNDQVFTPKIYSVANGHEANLLATGAAVTVPRATDGRWYVSGLGGLQLTAGTQYVFALDPGGAYNGTYVGADTDGETAFFVDYTPATTVPGAPARPVVVGGDGRVTVSFVAPFDGGLAITGYGVSCSSGDGGVLGSVSGVGSPLTVSGLTDGRSYQCVVSAANADGSGLPSPESASFVPSGVPGAPGAPVVVGGDGRVTVSFVAPFDGGLAITGYGVSCSSGDGGVLGSVSGVGSPLTVSGLTDGRSYQCVVSAANADGSGLPSPESASFVPSGVPGAPGAPVVVGGDGRVTVSFVAPFDGGLAITGYGVSCSSGDGGVLGSVSGVGSPLTVSGLTDGRSYQCVVSAANADGSGPPSPESASFVPSAPITVAARSGYWMLGADGKVFAFGDATHYGNAGGPVVAFAARKDGSGYWVVDAAGTVHPFGTAAGHGGRPALRPGEQVRTISATPSGNGYWLFTNNGRVFAYGDAHWHGDMAAVRLEGPIVASVATSTGLGYYLVGSDGGVFAFGDARFHGSVGGERLNRAIVGISPTPDGRGYWLVASDGGVFAFDAPFRGSMGGIPLNKPVTGLVAFGNGYLMVASDGGVFDLSDKPFVGSLGDSPPRSAIVGITAFTS